ncbi:hypothetical protein [Yoonia sp. 208BN28-4]|uniref:hypothetical protein n=1 Tax=Yoonia sp. 208BN28-4 TaxID=3126505 RepID=UPI0030B64D18
MTKHSPLSAEAARIAAIHDAARVPDDLRDVIPDAPARGAYKVTRPEQIVPQGADGQDYVPSRQRMMIVADVFDRMGAHASRRGKTCGLTYAQVAIGREYRDLCERIAAAGAPRSCLDDSVGGGDGTGVNAGLIDAQRRVAYLDRRIGDGVAKAVRRSRAMARHPITDMQLVRAVCCGDHEVTKVAASSGWADAKGRVQSPIVRALTVALSTALARMCDSPKSAPQTHVRTDVPPAYAPFARVATKKGY